MNTWDEARWLADNEQRLLAENAKLRECLTGTRVVIEQMKKHSSPGLHHGFDLWLARIDEALK